jgi:muramidase (phage lysozyme)
MRSKDIVPPKQHPVQEDWQDVKDFGREVGSGVVDIGKGAVDLAVAAGKDFVDPESYKRDWEAIKRGAKFAKDDPVGAAKYAARSTDDFGRAMANQATFGGADYAEAFGRKYMYGDSKLDKHVWDKYQSQQKAAHGDKFKPEPWTGSYDQYKKVQDIWSAEAEERSPNATAMGDFGGATLSVPFTGGARAVLPLVAKGTEKLAKIPGVGKALKKVTDIGAATLGGVAAEKGTGRVVRKYDPTNPYIGEPQYNQEQVPLPEARAPRGPRPSVPHTTPHGVTVDLNTKPPSFRGSGRKWNALSNADRQAAWNAEHAANPPPGSTTPGTTGSGAETKASELADKWRRFYHGTTDPAVIADIKAKAKGAEKPGVFKQALAKAPYTTAVGGTIAAGTLGSGLYNWKNDPTNQSIPFHIAKAATDPLKGAWTGLGEPGKDVGTAIGNWIDKKLGKTTGNTTTGGTGGNQSGGNQSGGGNQTDADDDGLGGRNLRSGPELGEVPTVPPNASPQRNESFNHRNSLVNQYIESLDTILSNSHELLEFGPIGEGKNPEQEPNYDELIKNPNVRIMLDLIGRAEGADYDTVVGGGKFKDFSSHPKIPVRIKTKGKSILSNAAGKYQIMGFNWEPYAKRLGLKDFSPESQDKIAVAMLKDRGALNSVLKGDFVNAIKKTKSQWASLPSSDIIQGYGPRSWKWVEKNLADLGNKTLAAATLSSPAQAADEIPSKTPLKTTEPGYYTVGDSHGVGIATYNKDKNWHNLSTTGSSAFSPDHLQNINKIPKGSVVVISMGANDLGGAKIPKIVNQVNATVAAAKERGLKVVYVLPTATTNPKSQQKREELRQALLKGLDSRDIVDLGTAPSSKEIKGGDGVHLGPKGYASIGSNIVGMLSPDTSASSKPPIKPEKKATDSSTNKKLDNRKSDAPNLVPQSVKRDSDLSTVAQGVKPITVSTKPAKPADKSNSDNASATAVDQPPVKVQKTKSSAADIEAKRRKQDMAISNADIIDASNKARAAQMAKLTGTDTSTLSGDELDRAKYGGSFKGKAYDPDETIIKPDEIEKVLQKHYAEKPAQSVDVPVDIKPVVKEPEPDESPLIKKWDTGIEALTGKKRLTPKDLNTVQVPESINTELTDILRLAGRK